MSGRPCFVVVVRYVTIPVLEEMRANPTVASSVVDTMFSPLLICVQGPSEMRLTKTVQCVLFLFTTAGARHCAMIASKHMLFAST